MKVKMTAEDLRSLRDVAEKNGTLSAWSVVALQWADAAQTAYCNQKTEADTAKTRLEGWDRASEFYRLCLATPAASEVGAMRDAIDWLCTIAAREVKT